MVDKHVRVKAMTTDQWGGTTELLGAERTIVNVNDGPALTGPKAVLAAGTEDTAYVVTKAALLAGFTDEDGDTLGVSGLAANHGTVVDNGDGTYTITPAANFNGTMTLSYSVTDGNGGSVAGQQTYSVAAVNDAPTGAAGRTGPRHGGHAVHGERSCTSRWLHGRRQRHEWTGAERVRARGQPRHGGGQRGRHLHDHAGRQLQRPDHAELQRHGWQRRQRAGLQAYSVTAVNDDPTGSARQAWSPAPRTRRTPSLLPPSLAGFTDVDIATNGQVLSVTGLSANHGAVVDNLDGTFTITPAANFNGTMTLSYSVTDGNGGSVAGQQTYSVAAVNDAPTGAAAAVLAAGRKMRPTP